MKADSPTTSDLDVLAGLVPDDEQSRMDAVRRYDILDTPPDGSFDRIAAVAARLFDVPIAIVSIVDTDRIWFKAHHGLDVQQIDRDPGLCASAILNDEPWVLTDASKDPRSLTNPLVAGEFGLKFYAGVPLTTHDGYNLGTLCVIDKTPRQVTDEELENLKDLAAVVMDEMELRRSAIKTVSLEAELRSAAEKTASLLQRNLLPSTLPSIEGVEISAGYHVAFRDQVGGDFYDVLETSDGFHAVLGDACGKGVAAASFTGIARWTLRAVGRDVASPQQLLTKLNGALSDSLDTSESYCTSAIATFVRRGQDWDVRVGLAGHPHPILVRGDGRVERVGSTSPVIGWEDDARYAESSHDMGPGDTLFMFTDGLFEILGHEAADDSALEPLLADLKSESPTRISEVMAERIGKGYLRDDVAFLVIRAK